VALHACQARKLLILNEFEIATVEDPSDTSCVHTHAPVRELAFSRTGPSYSKSAETEFWVVRSLSWLEEEPRNG
jgi:hypothetical protein